MRSLIFVASLLLPLLAVSPAAAAANGCALYNPAPPLANLVPVPPPYPNALGPATCVVVPLSPFTPPPVNGLVFVSGTQPCPALPFVGPVPGQYCGPLVPPGGTGICTAAVPVGFNIPLRAVVVGLDYSPSGLPTPADGNVFQVAPLVDHEPLRYDNIPGPPLTYSAQITNTLPFSARIIGYPVLQFESPGPVLMLCV